MSNTHRATAVSLFTQATSEGDTVTSPAKNRTDEGLFGPGSVAWKVWTFPASALQGFARAVTIEHLDPDLTAAVDETGQVIQRTPLRYDRTMEYFSAVLFADTPTVIRMSDILMKVHSRAYGTNKVTGNEYDSNDPDSQLWIHITAWHSILYVYETFGPGRLSRDEENEYWRQCAIAAEVQPIRPEQVPRSRGEVQKYFDDWRDRLSASEAAIANVDHILNGFETIEPRVPRVVQKLGRPVLRASIIATYPRWMRPMLGVRQSRAVDTAAVLFWKAIYRMAAHPDAMMWMVERICPRAVRYIEPAVRGIPADSPRTHSPQWARERFGDPRTPLEQWEDLKAARSEGEAAAPYEHNHTDPVLEFKEADRLATTG
ncbi:MAG TPA: DUF2236 domain-containing protein [Candidatus Dietzia intestinigallinarum]|nr:DUF2236 domain-containing protein [Candidatus Dietzia intestinigallinarum]